MEESYCKVECIPGEEELWPLNMLSPKIKGKKKTGCTDTKSMESLKCFYLGKGRDSGSNLDEYIKKQPSKSFQSCLVIAEYGSGVLWKAKPQIHYYWGKGRELAIQTAQPMLAVWAVPTFLSLVTRLNCQYAKRWLVSWRLDHANQTHEWLLCKEDCPNLQR